MNECVSNLARPFHKIFMHVYICLISYIQLHTSVTETCSRLQRVCAPYFTSLHAHACICVRTSCVAEQQSAKFSNTCTHTHTYTHIHTNTHTHTHTYKTILQCTCICMYACMYIPAQSQLQPRSKQPYSCIHVCMYAYMYVPAQSQLKPRSKQPYPRFVCVINLVHTYIHTYIHTYKTMLPCTYMFACMYIPAQSQLQPRSKQPYPRFVCVINLVQMTLYSIPSVEAQVTCAQEASLSLHPQCLSFN